MHHRWKQAAPRARAALLGAAAALAIGGAVAPAEAQPAADTSGLRLLALARVWEEARYFHPALAASAIRWDSVGAAAIERLERAAGDGALADAVAAMLAPLHDPVTRIVAASPAARVPRSTVAPSATWAEDSTLVLTVGVPLLTPATRASVAALVAQVARARRVVVDLRSAHGVSSPELGSLLGRARLDGALLDRETCGVAARRRAYVGYPTPFSTFAGWREPAAPCFARGSTVPKSGVVFVADSASPLPSIVPAMQAAGLATLVGVGTVTDAPLVAVDTIRVTPTLAVQMRLGALPACLGAGRLADTTLAPSAPALDVARQLAARTSARSRCAAAAAPHGAPTITAVDTALPSRAWRALAAFEIHGAVRFFNPHRRLVAGGDWDSVVAAHLPAVAGATTRADYLAAVSRLVATLNDGHAMLPPDRLLMQLGASFPPLLLRPVEGRLVVAQVFDTAAAPGVRPGQVVLSIDGRDARARFDEVRAYIPGSTAAARDAQAALFALVGAEGSTAELALADGNGARRTARLPRRLAYLAPVFNPASGEVLRILPGNVGYVDLRRVPQAAVDSMFARFGQTRALILDLRGYPQGTHPLIAGRLARREVAAARLRIPVVDGPNPLVPEQSIFSTRTYQESYHDLTQRGVPDGRGPYAGRVFVLVDDRTISQAEHAALFYRATAGATLVGTATGGADGNYVEITLPGRVGVAFTGMVVEAPDGTPVQGIGLPPDVRIAPTIAGIRAGRDEVLDCALELATRGRVGCAGGAPRARPR